MLCTALSLSGGHTAGNASVRLQASAAANVCVWRPAEALKYKRVDATSRLLCDAGVSSVVAIAFQSALTGTTKGPWVPAHVELHTFSSLVLTVLCRRVSSTRRPVRYSV